LNTREFVQTDEKVKKLQTDTTIHLDDLPEGICTIVGAFETGVDTEKKGVAPT
jgi:hypothetical protein